MKYRDDVPLSDNDFAEIRARVMARVGRRSRMLPAMAFTAVVIALAVIVWPRHEVRVMRRPPAQVVRFARDDKRPTAASTVPPALVARHKPHRARHRAVATPIVIHLQTANPDVRIIWITSKESS